MGIDSVARDAAVNRPRHTTLGRVLLWIAVGLAVLMVVMAVGVGVFPLATSSDSPTSTGVVVPSAQPS
jgi:hypothetical protein